MLTTDGKQYISIAIKELNRDKWSWKMCNEKSKLKIKEKTFLFKNYYLHYKLSSASFVQLMRNPRFTILIEKLKLQSSICHSSTLVSNIHVERMHKNCIIFSWVDGAHDFWTKILMLLFISFFWTVQHFFNSYFATEEWKTI